MNNQNDKQVSVMPKLRFPEFQATLGWQNQRLGALGIFIRGLTYSASDISNEGLLVLRSSNIQDNQLVLNKDLVYVRKECETNLLLKTGDVVICMSNGSKALVGKNAEYKGDYWGNATVGAFCSIFRAYSAFPKYLLKTDDYERFVSLSIGGGNINNLKNSLLENYVVAVPSSLKEQQKIADCLSSLDELIELQEQKLVALKQHKKGLMQQLFPSTK